MRSQVAVSLEELGLPRLHQHLVKRAVLLAMDRHDREREMVSVLLSALYGEQLGADQVQKGFLRLVESLPDTRLDIPEAVPLLANFVARAIVDDVLPPSFLGRCRDLAQAQGQQQGELAELVKRCDALLAGRHAAERQLRCWGSGAGLFHEETKTAVRRLLEEYLASGDLAEAGRRLRELAVPFFHHELVKGAVVRALEDSAKARPMVLTLLGSFAETGVVAASEMAKGLQRVVDSLDDLTLDVPTAPEQLRDLIREARDKGWVDPAFAGEPTATLPTPSSGAAGILGAAAATSGGRALPVLEFKRRATEMLREYYSSADAAEVARCLGELQEPGLHHLFVKRAVSLALDRSDRERELTAQLLSSLFPGLLTREQVALGFTMLLDSMEDLALDIPDATNLVSLFLGRAIVDDVSEPPRGPFSGSRGGGPIPSSCVAQVLPPSFLQSAVDRLNDTAMGLEVLTATGALLGMGHAAQMLENCFIKQDDDLGQLVNGK